MSQFGPPAETVGKTPAPECPGNPPNSPAGGDGQEIAVDGASVPPAAARRGISVKSRIAKGSTGEREVLLAIRAVMQNVEEEAREDGIAFVARSEFTNRKRREKDTSSRDIGNVPLISIEVKRHENLNINAAWQQTLKQSLPDKLLPVLVYRRNREAWRVRTWLAFVSPTGGFVDYAPATVTLIDFLAFYAKIYRDFLRQGVRADE